MTNAEDTFEKFLEVFQLETTHALEFVYTFHALFASMTSEPEVLDVINLSPMFWHVSIRALETSAVVTLGRIFETSNPDNIHLKKFLKHCSLNIDIFSRRSFEIRQLKLSGVIYSPSEIRRRVERAYEPSRRDFQLLNEGVEKQRKFYEAEVRPLRHKLYAHRGVFCESEISEASTQIDPVKTRECVLYLVALARCLWNLYHEGVFTVPAVINIPASQILSTIRHSQDQLSHEQMVVRDVAKALLPMKSAIG